MDIVRVNYLYVSTSKGYLSTQISRISTQIVRFSTFQLKSGVFWICMELGGFIYISHDINPQSLLIFFARKCDFWRQWIQWIYIELHLYPQSIAWTYMNFNRYPWANVWNYMNFNRFPHIGRGPTCR